MVSLAMMDAITRSNFGERDYLFYIPTTLHHPETGRIWRQEPKQRRWRPAVYWLATPQLARFASLCDPGPSCEFIFQLQILPQSCSLQDSMPQWWRQTLRQRWWQSRGKCLYPWTNNPARNTRSTKWGRVIFPAAVWRVGHPKIKYELGIPPPTILKYQLAMDKAYI